MRTLSRGVEARRHERAQVEAGVLVCAQVFLEDGFGARAWNGIDEGLAVLVHAVELHALEETGIELGRSPRCRVVVTGGRRRSRQNEKQSGDDGRGARSPADDE